MWISRLSLKLFLVYAGLNLTLAVGYVTFVARWQRQLVMDQVEERLLDTAFVLRNQLAGPLPAGDTSALQRSVRQLAEETHIRITLIDARGVVQADSDEDPQRMGNHSDRPEVIQALARGFGKSVRYSGTLREPMFYLALPIRLPEHGPAFVRVALPIESIEQQVTTLHHSLWLVASVVGVIALGLTLMVAGRLLRPLARLTEAAEAVAAGDYACGRTGGGTTNWACWAGPSATCSGNWPTPCMSCRPTASVWRPCSGAWSRA